MKPNFKILRWFGSGLSLQPSGFLRRSRPRQEGSLLVIVLCFLLIITVITGSMLSWAGSERVMLARRSSRIDALYGAESATRRAMAQVRALYFSNYSTNSYITGGLAAPSDAQLANLTGVGQGPTSVSVLNNGYTYNSFNVAYTTGTSTNRYTTYSIQNTDASLSAYAGLNSSRASILCSASATSKTAGASVPAIISQQFNIDYIPVFQYAIFYNMDMECFNGPTMTANGRVHCNGNLFYAPADTLTINSYLTADGDIRRGIKMWNSGIDKLLSNRDAVTRTYYNNSQAQYEADASNWVAQDPAYGSYGDASFYVKNPQSGSLVNFRTGTSPLAFFDSDSAGWAGGALTRWGGGVKSESQGVSFVEPPVPDDVMAAASDPTNPYHVMIEAPSLDASGVSTENATTKSAKMAYNVSLLIQRSGTNIIYRLKDSNGVYHKVSNSDLRNAANIVASGTTTFHDQREYLQNGGVKMTVTEFDVSALYGAGGANNAGAMDSSGVWKKSDGTSLTQDASGNTFSPVPFDGTVYIYDDNYSGSRKPAIRIKNGSTIYDKDSNASSNNGITILSQNPVYIQGNFNSDGSITTGPEKTGGSDENCPPAMIAADVVSVLSTSWAAGDDNPGGGTFNAATYGGRTGGANTEINAAILAGVNRSSQNVAAGSFDGTTGGVNNFMRFLENWSGTYKYSGSMVSLWYGAQATSTYRGAGTANGVFSAPTRDWAFNTDFLDPNKLPRITPIIRVYTTAAWKNF
jgi:Tfp pilus assembly protein PilX